MSATPEDDDDCPEMGDRTDECGRAGRYLRRTMHARTLVALKGSIAKWEKIAAGEGVNNGCSDCPLCELFNNGKPGPIKCHGCPVYERTGRVGCSGSPYDAFADHEAGDHDCRDCDCEEGRYLAQAEVDFLKSLLPDPTPASA